MIKKGFISEIVRVSEGNIRRRGGSVSKRRRSKEADRYGKNPMTKTNRVHRYKWKRRDKQINGETNVIRSKNVQGRRGGGGGRRE